MNFKHVVLISSVISGMHLGASAASYKWADGSTNVAAQGGVYGTKGTAAANNIPGGRGGSSSGAESTNLWMFGGLGYDSGTNYSIMNDLWKYDTTTGQWTWVSGSDTGYQMGTYGTKGTPDSGNVPGARAYQLGWNDSSGNFWVFGGFGANDTDFGYLNDLWKFDGTQWTWVSGTNTLGAAGVYGTQGTGSTSNSPGARLYSVSAIDSSGNVWVFGGYGVDGSGNEGYLADLWKYNPSNNQWTWVSGSNSYGQAAVYGTKGTGSVNNIPGPRSLSHVWVDSSDNIWVFGGYGMDSYASIGNLNDLWKFDTTNGTWTWVSGDNTVYSSGTYGTMGTPASGNVPGARQIGNFWIGADGNLWLFGGYGNDSTGYAGVLNDLWNFDLTSGHWTWYAGASTANQAGTWGTQGTGSSSNIPSSRYMSTSFKNSSGTNFWLFGGIGSDVNNDFNFLSDLWNLTY